MNTAFSKRSRPVTEGWYRGVLVREPVRRIERVVNLGLGILLGAAGPSPNAGGRRPRRPQTCRPCLRTVPSHLWRRPPRKSAAISGLPAAYIIRQMAAFKNGERTGGRAPVMIAMAKVLTDADVKAAAEYYAALKPRIGYNKVIETETVAKSYVGPGGMRFATPDGGTEPIGNRIIVLPEDPLRAELRDPKSGFIDYVPVGSIKKGEALATTGDAGKTIPCAICHGQNLKGLGEIPGIVGRPATYVFRQLNDMQNGNRKGAGVELMKGVVAKLTDDDLIALAAYLGSRDP